MAIRRIDAHWRDSGRIPRFFMMDARSFFPMFLFLLHIRWWTFFLAFGVGLFFGTLEHYGFSMLVFARATRSYLAGKTKFARPWWRRERFR